MMDQSDRYILALGVLNREPDTHKILGDFLEESGERGLAQWARAKKSFGRKRLEFTMALLPWRVVLALGSDFVANEVSSRKKLLEHEYHTLYDLSEDEFFTRIDERVMKFPTTRKEWDTDLYNITPARGREAISLAISYARNIAALGAQYEELMRNQVRDIAKTARDPQWQTARLRIVIEQLLT